MNILWKKTLKSLFVIFILLIFFSLITNILYYFDIINNNALKYIEMIYIIISYFVGGFIMGKNSPNKGYIYGLRLSVIVILLLFIISIILNELIITNIIYYIIVTVSITFGSMLGINKKTN